MTRFLPLLFLLLLGLILAVRSSNNENVQSGEGKSIIDLDSDTFDSVINSDESKYFFIKFYAPWCGHCRNLEPTWESLAQKLNTDAKSQTQICRVNCDENRSVCSKFGVQGYPTLQIFKNGESIGNYFGSRSLKDLEDFATRKILEVPSSDGSVVELNANNFDALTSKFNSQWFVKFYAPWCGHCKALTPTWESLARELKGSNTFIGKVDCTKESEICGRFSVNGYPTLHFMKNNKFYEYDNFRTLESLKSFVKDGYTKATPQSKPAYGSSSILVKLFSNPVYLVIFVVSMICIMFACLGAVICLLSDDSYTPEVSTKSQSSNGTSDDKDEEDDSKTIASTVQSANVSLSATTAIPVIPKKDRKQD